MLVVTLAEEEQVTGLGRAQIAADKPAGAPHERVLHGARAARVVVAHPVIEG